LPTLTKLTGAQNPQNKIDGVDIWSLMTGDEKSNPRKAFYYYYGRQLCAVREGNWKLMFPHTYRSYEGVEPGKDGFPGPYAQGKCGLELYNMGDDVSEEYDVAHKNPDIVKKLMKLGDKARDELGDTLTGKTGKEIREPGRISSKKELKVEHKAIGKKLSLKNDPHARYAGKGPETLLNGRYGSDDYQDGQWLGFEGIDFEAIIDMGTETKINTICCSLLQDQVSWIFFPKQIEISVSNDGQSFRKIKTINEKVKVDQETKHKEFCAENVEASARFVRLAANNVGTCPEWHPGAGGKAWMFIDEIVVN